MNFSSSCSSLLIISQAMSFFLCLILTLYLRVTLSTISSVYSTILALDESLSYLDTRLTGVYLRDASSSHEQFSSSMMLLDDDSKVSVMMSDCAIGPNLFGEWIIVLYLLRTSAEGYFFIWSYSSSRVNPLLNLLAFLLTLLNIRLWFAFKPAEKGSWILVGDIDKSLKLAAPILIEDGLLLRGLITETLPLLFSSDPLTFLEFVPAFSFDSPPSPSISL